MVSTTLSLTYQSILSHKKTLSNIVWVDLVFVIGLLLFTKYVSPFFTPSTFQGSGVVLMQALILLFLYYGALLCFYSTCKYVVMNIISTAAKRKKSPLVNWWNFFVLNLILAGLFALAFLGVALILASLKEDILGVSFIILMIPYTLFLYVMLNTSHSLFYQQQLSPWQTLKQSFSFVGTKFSSYLVIFITSIIYICLSSLLLFGLGKLISNNNAGYHLIEGLLLYALIFFNRVHFYFTLLRAK